jgi:ssDNA-binding Zn-finger/Zn-ribbon topoisomerase 1
MSFIGKQNCPDCDGSMKQIDIIDKATSTSLFSRPKQTALQYLISGGKKNFFTGQYPIKGRVCAIMCDTCNRILLYGVPNGR